MHVHVDVADDEEGVRVIDGLRPWLPLLTALTANSPYASGRDTGYASWRQQVWTRWPTSGTAEPFGSAAEYHRVRDTMIRLGAALDDGMLYYDARLSAAYPTVEIRVADTCTDLDDAVLARRPGPGPGRDPRPSAAEPAEARRSDLLRAAWWRCARYGLDRRPRPSGDLGAWCPRAEALAALAEEVGPRPGGRRRHRPWSRTGWPGSPSAGTGARRQRQAFERTGDLRGVVADLVTRTAEAAAA